MDVSHDTKLTSATDSKNCTSAKTEMTYAKLFTTKESAKFLHMSLRNFQYLTNAKKIQPVQIGARNTKFYSLMQLLTYAKNSPMQKDPCKDENCTG